VIRNNGLAKNDSLQKKKKQIVKKGYTFRKINLFPLKENTFIIILCIGEFYIFQFINYYLRVRQNLLFHKYIDISKMNTKSLIHVMLGQINISLNIKKYLNIANIFFKLI
jgi:hypothetical protein